MTDHPDFEALSAYHDGEAPEWAEHVRTCEACRARLEEIRAVAGAIRQPVGPPPEAAVDESIRRALAEAAGTGPPATADQLADRRHRRRSVVWTAAASVAALLVAVVGTVGVLRRGDGGRTTADRALTEAPPPSAAPRAESSTDAQGATPGDIDNAVVAGDLGAFADSDALIARVEPAVRAVGALSGRQPTAAQESPSAPRVVGTRPCEFEVRELDPGVDDVVYVATATVEDSPVVVLAFTRREAAGPGSPVTLMVLARDGCRLVSSRPL